MLDLFVNHLLLPSATRRRFYPQRCPPLERGGGIGFGAKPRGLTAKPIVQAETTAVVHRMKGAVHLSNFLLRLGFESVNMVPVNCGSTDRSDVCHCQPILQLARQPRCFYYFIRGFSRIMIRSAGRIKRFLPQLSRVESGRIGSGGFQILRVGSGRGDPTRPNPTREK